MSTQQSLRVAVIGAGPAGIYASDLLIRNEEHEIYVDLFEQMPAAVFAIDRQLASRREASVLLVARSRSVSATSGTRAGTSLALSLWYELGDAAIRTVRLQVARVTG